MRAAPEGEPESVLVLRTLGAPQRRLLGGRRGRTTEAAEPEPVPTARATVVRAEPFPSSEEASEWLASVRADADRAEEQVALATAVVNRALHAHRVASADPYIVQVSRDRALVVRIGFGVGDEVADGRFAEAWELPPGGPKRPKRSMETPEERFAAILGGREPALACEELVLRARADLDAGRRREAALEARVALEALLAEVPHEGSPGALTEALSELAADREAIGAAANAALRGDLTPDQATALAEAIARMESVLRRRRLGA